MRPLIGRACAAAVVAVLASHGALAQKAATWAFDASAYTYFVPDSSEFVSPVVKADRDWLHLEARYNYEGLRTASLWAGYNVSVGKELALDLTLMLGGVFGDTAGIAPGWRFSLRYGRVELASESEYVIDFRESADGYFYNWSELSVAPADWLRAGLVVQRTRLYGEDRELQRGFLVGFSCEKVYATAYVFNPDLAKPTFVLAVGVGF